MIKTRSEVCYLLFQLLEIRDNDSSLTIRVFLLFFWLSCGLVNFFVKEETAIVQDDESEPVDTQPFAADSEVGSDAELIMNERPSRALNGHSDSQMSR